MPLGESAKAYRWWICLSSGPDHQGGGGTGLLLSSHRWDVLRHILGPAVEGERRRDVEGKGERERGDFIPVNESINSAVASRSPIFFN